MTTHADVADRSALIHRGMRLEYFTVGYNFVEGIVAIAAGWLAGSVALIGFGVDSAIEVSSGAILLWRLYSDADEQRREEIERRALRLVGVSFILLAAYVTYDASMALIRREPPDESILGMILAAASLVIMPILVRKKRTVAAAIRSAALQADATQTAICTILSAILLVGVGINTALGWWWADPLAALAMVPFIVKEGLAAFRGDPCCD